MSSGLCLIIADFLEHLAESEKPLEIGAFGPKSYTKRDAKRIGPLIAELAGKGLIRRDRPGTSCRVARNGGLVNYWRSNDREACLRKAAEFRRRAKWLDIDGNDERQQRLF